MRCILPFCDSFFVLHQIISGEKITVVLLFPRFLNPWHTTHFYQFFMKFIITFKYLVKFLCRQIFHTFQNLFQMLHGLLRDL